jgi:threonine dehydrogenase-like Zn-dependent dehydrogenase
MKGLVYHGPWDLRLEQIADPVDPRGDQVVVGVQATGICGTDLGVATGAYRARARVVLGHESAGVVEAVGPDVAGLRVGDRVVIDPTFSCSLCRMCRIGRPNHCRRKLETEAGVWANGTNAEFFVTTERFLYPISDRTSYAESTLVEPLSCAMTGVAQLTLRPDLVTVVIGGGPMGLVYAHALALRGVVGTLFETSPARRALARDNLPPGWTVSEPCGVTEMDVAVDTTAACVDWCLQHIVRGGQILVVGLAGVKAAIDVSMLADRSISLLGSIDSIGTFSTACTLVDQRRVDTRGIVTHQVSLDDFPDAFALLGVDLASQRREPDGVRAMKVVLTQ